MDRVTMIGMSNKQLVETLDNLVSREAQSLIAVLEHLAIIEERKVYLAEGYPSMFAYLQKRYNYTESSACRRITAARAMHKFPLVRTYLESRAINLGTLSLLAKNLTQENCQDLLEMASRKKREAVEKLLIAGGHSVPGVSSITKNKFGKDKIKAVVIEPLAIISDTPKANVLNDGGNSSCSTDGATGCHTTGCHTTGCHTTGCHTTSCHTGRDEKNEQICGAHSQELFPLSIDSNNCDANTEVTAATAPTTASLPKIGYHIEFYANEELKNNIEKMRTLLSSRYPRGVGIADMFNYLCQIYFKMEEKQNSRAKKQPAMVEEILEDQEPEVIQPAQTQSVQTQIVQPLSPQLPAEVESSPCIESVEGIVTQGIEPNTAPLASSNLTRRRYIPKAVRRRVFERDGGCCSFVGDNGQCCQSAWDIEVEHIIPFGKGGTNDENNLTLLCRAHNHFRAEQEYGRDFMRQKCKSYRQNGGEMTKEVRE